MSSNNSISRSINTKMLIAIVISTLFFIITSYIITAYSERKNLIEDANTATTRFVKMLETPLWNFDTDLIDQYVEIFMGKHNICSIKITSDSGKTITFTENHKYKDKANSPHYLINEDIVSNNVKLGKLTVEFSEQSIFNNITRLILTNMILVLILTIVLILLIKQTIKKQVITPLNVMLESINDISKGDYTRSVEGSFRFEFETIKTAFNQMIQDINTSTKETKEINFKINTLLDTIPDAVFLHDSNGQLVEVNKTAKTMYGFPDDVLSLSASESSGDGYTDEMAAVQIKRAIDEGQTEFEWMAKHISGTEFPVVVRLKSLKMYDETYVLAVVTDVSEKKKAESRLLEEKEKLNVTLRSIGDAVIVTDNVGNIILMNDAAQLLTGYCETDVLDENIDSILHLVNSKSNKRIFPPVKTAVQTRKVQAFSRHTLLISKDESERLIEGASSPVVEKDNVIGVVFVFKDITEKEKMEQEIIKNQKLESIGLLAGGIAHDFNNLLAAISSYISLIKVNSTPDDNGYKYLKDVESIIENAKGLTGQLLTFSKGGAPVKTSLKVIDIIEDSSKFVLSGTGIKINITKDDDLWSTDIDENQISQAIHNLILNAKQAMNNKGQITVSVFNKQLDAINHFSLPAGQYVHISIADTGTGIDEALLDKIFDPFFTTKESGNGLGLAMVHSIILKHNGYINATSVKGKGTEFEILLPANNTFINPQERDKQSVSYTDSANILILDDERIIRESASELLSFLGHNVRCVADGVDAVSEYQNAMGTPNQFDLVILDLTIPGGMGGEETMEKLLSVDKNITAIVSSGYSDDEVMAKFDAFGFKGVIAKPYNIEKLSQVLQRTLGKT